MALHHTSFTGRDGAPVGVTSFAQTSDGFLWVGTHYGLYQFDGVRFQIRADDQLQSSHIHSLWADRNGDLWIGFSVGGVSVLRNGQITNYSGNGLPPGTAFGIARTPDGVLWVVTTLGVGQFTHSAWHSINPTWGLAIAHPQEMHLASDGTLWIADGQHAFRLPPNAKHFETLDLSAYAQQGLGSPASIPSPDTLGVSATVADSSGAVWQANKTGLIRYRWPNRGPHATPPVAETLNPQTPLSGVFVYDMFEDSEGNFWLGTNGGLDRFRATRLNVVPFDGAIFQPAFAPGDHGDIWVASTRDTGYHVTDVVAKVPAIPLLTSMMTRDRKGTIWLSAPPGLMQVQGDQIRNFGLPSGLKTVGFSGQALATEGDGSIWFSIAGHGLYRYKDESWTANGGLKQLPSDQNPLSLLAAYDGSMWLGYSKNRLFQVSGDKVTHFDTSNGIAVGAIQVIEAHDDQVWVGGERGVDYLKGGVFTPLKGAHGETFKDISGIVETADGDVWLNGAFGLYRITAVELKRLNKEPAYSVTFDHFTMLDGLDGPAVQIRPTPTLIRGSDGRLWAATENGVVWIDPRLLGLSNAELRPVIQTLNASGVAYTASGHPEFPKGTNGLRVDYTAPLLGEPERLRFRYRLVGLDPTWQDADARRQAYFTNLAPGTYTFELQAKLEGGMWSSNQAEAIFSIAPNFYQTWWFDALVVAALLVFVWLWHHLRIRRLEARMRIRRNERERVARDLHDTLLQSVQGLILQVHVASDYDANPQVRQQVLAAAVQSAQSVLKEGRDKVMELRNEGSGAFDLAESIRQLILNSSQGYTGSAKLVITGNPTTLNHKAEDEIFSIVREMITNVWKHAEASSFDVVLRYGWIFFTVRVIDNGLGIPDSISKGGAPSGRWGILGMKERARQFGGSVSLRPGDKRGTEVTLRMPSSRVYQHRWTGL
ncbi:signal transduction histidine kinase/ligand-binding sensor domain-containing protein [Rhodanobacter sp. ANJX3]|uniref:sensor histidine kinase n=1 Tax=Rhodanobacter sp. ANJX3 TaxID=2723083 RepID=UPI00161EE90C|nr:sensor histidine kinase [Rhodanobacter sp. ANJX3]MBB5357090.1 signal transduction histidine kinase/ligand-binding sensor domain-containing protein [Rhodanobacter sp. ANJX3]